MFWKARQNILATSIFTVLHNTQMQQRESSLKVPQHNRHLNITQWHYYDNSNSKEIIDNSEKSLFFINEKPQCLVLNLKWSLGKW